MELPGTPRPHSHALLRSDSLTPKIILTKTILMVKTILTKMIVVKVVETMMMNLLTIQAWPKPINYWTFGTGEMIVANDKFVVEENELNGYKFQLVLVIKKLEKVQKQF